MDAGPATSSRRQFGKECVLLAAAPLVAAQQVEAQVDPTTATVEALFAIVRLRHGKFLTPAQLEQVRLQVSRSQHLAGMMRAVKLGNSDEPAFAARADLP